MEKLKNQKFNISKIFLLIIFYAIIGIGIVYSTRKIHFEENLSSIIPANKENEFLREILDSASFFDRMIVHVYFKDSTKNDPATLISVANDLTDSINQKLLPGYISKIEGRTDI